MSVATWIKSNKLSSILIIVLLIILLLPVGLASLLSVRSRLGTSSYYESNMVGANPSGLSSKMMSFSPSNDYYAQPTAPTPEVKNRLVVQNSTMSLLVKNVSDSLAQIKAETIKFGGYMVSANLNKPEEGDTGTITVRVPSEKLDSSLAFFRSLGVKVVSENLTGDDVTDQFVDNEAKLIILERNKARFEEIMLKAITTDEILRVQQEIFNLQAQVDQIKGQQKYLEASAKTSLVTLYLSTDELSLPYAPSQAWRPDVIFKHAIRSLVGTLRGLGSFMIWLGVYSVVWVPVILIIKLIKKRRKAQKAI